MFTATFTCIVDNAAPAQDRAEVSPTGDAAVVADGHSRNGGYFAEESVKRILARHVMKAGNIEEWSREIHNELLELLPRIDASIVVEDSLPRLNRKIVPGGTTVSFVAWDNDSQVVTVANAGDSSVVYFYQTTSGRIGHRLLSVSHTPQNEDEWRRIEALRASGHPHIGHLVWECPSGVTIPIYASDGMIDYFTDYQPVEKLEELYFQTESAHRRDPSNQEKRDAFVKVQSDYNKAFREFQKSPIFPYRSRMQYSTVDKRFGSYLKSQPGDPVLDPPVALSCTCTIGDYASKKIGSRAEWDVHRYPLADLPQGCGQDEIQHQCILAASDGVWDCWMMNELAVLVLSAKSADALTLHFAKRAIEKFGRHRDDISAALVVFKK
jgi:serine/threonine protein phosphatase PrpC